MSKSNSELEKALLDIQKLHGDDAITRLTGRKIEKHPYIPTGCLSLDAAIGIGGYPVGRIVEVFGPESSGKTTLTLHAIANVQADGGIAAFIDAEHALDLGYAQALGVVTDDLLFSQPDNGEMALSIAEHLVDSGSVSLVVIDSVAALTPKAEIEGEMGAYHLGVHARLMSQALRKLAGVCSKKECTVIFINQIRHKIGVMFGSPETTTGGNALKFYASVRLDIRRREQKKDGADEAVGNRTEVKVVKNKMAPPFQECEFDIIWGKGIDRVADIVALGVRHGVIEKSGAWLSYDGERLGQGFNNAAKNIGANPKIHDAIRTKIAAIVLPT